MADPLLTPMQAALLLGLVLGFEITFALMLKWMQVKGVFEFLEARKRKDKTDAGDN